MILTKHNDRQYDSRNFDRSKNYYAIKYDAEKYQILKDKNNDDLYIVYTQYLNTELFLSVDYDKETSNSIYKIIYGHFYNDQNFFLFKKIHNDKIVGYKINKCKRTELWHNKLNQLYISNYFLDAKKTAVILNTQANNDISQETENPALSYINYDDETLIFTSVWNSDYQTEILSITIDQPYMIEYKEINLN